MNALVGFLSRHSTAQGDACLDEQGRVGLGGPAGWNEDRSVAAVVRGDLHGYPLLRIALQGRGHRFETLEPAELLCHLYQEHELDLLRHVRGETSFLLFDRSRRRLVAGRDPYGSQPLYYAEVDGRLWVTSRLRSLVDLGLKPRWDESAFYHAATHQALPVGSSWLAGVRQVPPGCLLVAEGEAVRIHPPGGPERAQPLEEFGFRLDDALRCRLPRGPGPAFALSGGLASAALVSLASQSLAGMMAFTVAFEHEEDWARQVAERWRVRLEVLRPGREERLAALPEAVAHWEGVSADASLSARYLLRKRMGEAGFALALAGDRPGLPARTACPPLALLREGPPAVGPSTPQPLVFADTRLPFFDPAVAESPPSEARARLREAVRSLVPDGLVEREHHCFPSPALGLHERCQTLSLPFLDRDRLRRCPRDPEWEPAFHWLVTASLLQESLGF